MCQHVKAPTWGFALKNALYLKYSHPAFLRNSCVPSVVKFCSSSLRGQYSRQSDGIASIIYLPGDMLGTLTSSHQIQDEKQVVLGLERVLQRHLHIEGMLMLLHHSLPNSQPEKESTTSYVTPRGLSFRLFIEREPCSGKVSVAI